MQEGLFVYETKAISEASSSIQFDQVPRGKSVARGEAPRSSSPGEIGFPRGNLAGKPHRRNREVQIKFPGGNQFPTGKSFGEKLRGKLPKGNHERQGCLFAFALSSRRECSVLYDLLSATMIIMAMMSAPPSKSQPEKIVPSHKAEMTVPEMGSATPTRLAFTVPHNATPRR